ncbi:MAG: NAD(P)H-hydrate epimerase [Alcaligenaceae bacterium]|nr:NAD(P)H-hydrate epimerase [Alcaligenaceae bacterium]
MKRIYTAEEMRRAEQSAVDRGTSFEQLMENAGQAVAKNLLTRIGDGRLTRPESVLIICGKGNNAGDGLVIARVLAEQGLTINLGFLLGTELSLLSMLNLQRLESFEQQINYLEDDEIENFLVSKCDNLWIIDAIFGTGYSGNLPDKVSKIMGLVNQTGTYRIALDLPSGLNCDTGDLAKNTFNANLTYTFAAYKPAHFTAHGKVVCGEIVCLDIGI